jgi:hypothetical protein
LISCSSGTAQSLQHVVPKFRALMEFSDSSRSRFGTWFSCRRRMKFATRWAAPILLSWGPLPK